jgi:hypothetical protein
VTLGFKTVCNDVTVPAMANRTCMFDNENMIHWCNVTTPGGIQIPIQSQDTNWFTSFRSVATDDVTFPAITKFATYRISNFSPDDIEKTATQHMDEASVMDCSLSAAVFQYQNASSNGSRFAIEDPIELIVPVDFGSLANISAAQSFHTFNLTDLEVLSIGVADVEILQSFFMSKMFSSEWVAGGKSNIDYGISPALMGDVDLVARFTSMAKSMTDYMRTAPARKIMKGNSIQTVVFVKVGWYWLIGPAAMEIAALSLAVITMSSNYRSDTVFPPWKSSTLALLSCNYDEQDGKLRSRVKDIRLMDKLARNSKVRLD